MKVQVKRAFKSYFLSLRKQKETRQALHEIFFNLQYKCAYILCFKINASIFCCFNFFEECLNPQVRINKMAKEHTVNYDPSPSEFISRTHRLIFLWTPKGFIFPEFFMNFFSNLYIPPWLQKSFKFMVLRFYWKTNL